jgi:DNA-binding MarR family transcriptional regulator
VATDDLDLVTWLFASPALRLGIVGRAAARSANEAVAAVGLRPRSLFVLALLHDHGPMSQQALGEELEVDPSVLVVLLNQLEADGLASRQRDASDRRRHIVAITDRGVARLRDGQRAVADAEDKLLANLDRDQRDQLAQLLVQIQPASGAAEECETVAAEDECETGPAEHC